MADKLWAICLQRDSVYDLSDLSRASPVSRLEQGDGVRLVALA